MRRIFLGIYPEVAWAETGVQRQAGLAGEGHKKGVGT